MSAFARHHLGLVLRTTGPAVSLCIERGSRWDDQAAELAAEGLRAARVLGLYDSQIATRDEATAKAPAATKPAECSRSVMSGDRQEAA